MKKKYLIPILGIMAFVSFVAYATAQTKTIPQSQPIEESMQVSQNEGLPVLSPEVASANTSFDAVDVSGVQNSTQSMPGQNLISTPVVPPVIQQAEDPKISPIVFNDDVSDREFESNDRDSENSHYEDDEADDD